jgi:inosine-uridine nucleoside N-ribohydrolase
MWTRRKALGGMAAGGWMLACRGLTGGSLQAQERSVILPPNGVAVAQPRLRGIRRVIIDTDPGNDDALALLMAMAAPELVVDAITVCPGNMGTEGYDQQVRNALFLVDLAGKGGRIPVYRGMAKPLLNRPYPVATFIHGKYGLGDVEVPNVKQKPEAENAVDMMIQAVNAAPNEITILALGGLTNVAMAVLRDPGFAGKLKGILFVGGRYATPGMPPSYNVLVDPEAADIVFSSGAVITLNAADISNRDSVLVAEDYDHATSLNTKRSRFFIASNNLRRAYEMKYRGASGSVNADPMAVSLAIDPSIGIRFMQVFVRVELEGEYTRGMLVYGDDIYSGHAIPPANTDVCIQANAAKFKALVFRTLAVSD